MAKRKAIAWSPVRAIMKSVGASMVARDAVDYLVKYLIELAEDITKKALIITRHGKRTKISKADLELVLGM